MLRFLTLRAKDERAALFPFSALPCFSASLSFSNSYLYFVLTCSWNLKGFEKNNNSYIQHTELDLDTNIKQREIKQSLIANPHRLKLFGVVLEFCV